MTRTWLIHISNVVCCNRGKLLSLLHEDICGRAPGYYMSRFLDTQIRRYRNKTMKHYPKMRFATADADYGMVDENIEPDLPKDEYDSKVSMDVDASDEFSVVYRILYDYKDSEVVENWESNTNGKESEVELVSELEPVAGPSCVRAALTPFRKQSTVMQAL
ncbi:hypothetical protein RN001_003308 [Aquatica leii]|uniref:Uncharacterized protein n=1 Tax=Aquatica leii TaxID=1421715 RepID=A0AAN7PI45_9COLE|nr:hypothetical protein RN001_003308 [Aquatica leii]